MHCCRNGHSHHKIVTYKISNVFLNLRKMPSAFQLSTVLMCILGVGLLFVTIGYSYLRPHWSVTAINVYVVGRVQRKRSLLHDQVLVLLDNCDKAALLQHP